MAKRNSLENVNSFCEILSEQISTRFGNYPTIKDIIYHLSERGLIRPITLRNYLIIDKFYKKLRINDGHITHTVMDMSIEFNLSERQVQTIIYDYQKKFKKDENILNRRNCVR
tara:strand:- start:293 stop:631 length:339 start_codon:yes stop_codon:yes gene_type:complete